jgi:hypothetical protein
MRDRVWWIFVAILALSCSSTKRNFDGPGSPSAGAAGLGAGAAGASHLAGGGAAGSAGDSDDGGQAGDTAADPCATVACDEPGPCQVGPGTCAPATGECTYALKDDDTECSNVDNNACTADVCQAGVCTAGAPTMCPMPAACHTMGTCNATSGVCSTPNAMDHTSCGTSVECLGGTCQCTVTSCPNGCCAAGKCGVCTPTTLATRTASVQALAISSTQLFFLENAGGSLVYSLPVTGGTAAMLSYPPPNDTLSTITADGAYVYAATFSNSIPGLIGRMSTAGGAFTTITGSQTWEGSRLLTNTASVFSGSTLSSSYLRAIPKAGGTVVPLVSSIAIDYQHYAVDDSFLYFIGANGTVIDRIAVAGGDPLTVMGADANELIKDVALSGTQLGFASSTRIAKVAAAGGTATPLTTGTAYALLADNNALYFFRAVGGSTTCASGTDIFAVPLAGGALRRLATETTASCISSPAQDASALYWLAGNVIKKTIK